MSIRDSTYGAFFIRGVCKTRTKDTSNDGCCPPTTRLRLVWRLWRGTAVVFALCGVSPYGAASGNRQL